MKNALRDKLLAAVVDRLIPADADPGAIEAGTLSFVMARLSDASSDFIAALDEGLAAVDDSARRLVGRSFLEASPEERDHALASHEKDAWFSALGEFAAEGFYADPGNGGNRDAASWRMIGYDPNLPERAAPTARISQPALKDNYDAIVVGAGAGGGVVAALLAEAGHSVLVLERGRDYGADDPLARDHLRNQRFSPYGHNAGPDIEGHPRVLVDPAGVERALRPHEPGYHNNAAAVGGGTLVYGAQAWRFHPDDFRMASRYGVPEGSSLADWPFSYADLEPHYDRAEWEIGVSGEAGHPSPRRRGFPMPPADGHASRRILTEGAAKVGCSTFAAPLLINTIARDGRAACVECGSCVGFRCPSDAKNGAQNTVLQRAVKTGRCTIVERATATRVEVDADGRVAGVSFMIEGDDQRSRSARAKVVALACGAIETARLMLLSTSERHPRGLGNERDLVGRNLQGHFSAIVHGLFEEQVYDRRGPGVTVATCRFNHGNPGVIGGSMIADDFIMLPVIFWKRAMPPDAPRWGRAAKDFMRANYQRVIRLFAPVQDIPTPLSRVTLDERVRDKWGLPVARLSGVAHIESQRTAQFMRERAEEWLRASGAVRVWADPIAPRLSAGQHQAGTCRMGLDPATSVTDPFGRVWGHDNLYVADGSLHPTNGGFNPVLTIMAVAYRNGEHIAQNLRA
ncbi:GMC family oxidoreductase [Terrarubrum flagellatum]|uniref:GMC family oxidoreductase n=1 Tax=Terrirubrum flagellatum TaxID=2895980 RepID=UPI0031452016